MADKGITMKLNQMTRLRVVGVSTILTGIVIGLLVVIGGATKSYGVHVVDKNNIAAQMKPVAWFQPRSSSFADLAEKVGPAVVNISIKKRIRSTYSSRRSRQHPMHDFFKDFFGDRIPQDRMESSLGSGFIIDKNGTILTNNHVVQNADEIVVALSDGREFKAKIIGKDMYSDIAVIKIDVPKGLPYVPLGNSNAMRPGDWVMAIGNPFGLEHTVTVGVVSAKGRLVGGGYGKYIQTDASINPGNSGGPLFNMNGDVIGINTMVHSAAQGIGFAIPVDTAKALLPQLLSEGKVTRGWLGVSIQKMTSDLAKSFGFQVKEGTLITDVYDNSPAAKAGLKRADIVTHFNGDPVTKAKGLSLYVKRTKPGSKVILSIIRKNKIKRLSVIIGSMDNLPGDATPVPHSNNSLGLQLEEITPHNSRTFNVPSSFKGVVITDVPSHTVASDAGLTAGDIILEINDQKIKTLSKYNKVMSSLSKNSFVRFYVKRGQAGFYIAFQLK